MQDSHAYNENPGDDDIIVVKWSTADGTIAASHSWFLRVYVKYDITFTEPVAVEPSTDVEIADPLDPAGGEAGANAQVDTAF